MFVDHAVERQVPALIALLGIVLLLLVLAAPMRLDPMAGRAAGVVGLSLLTLAILAFGARMRPE